MGKVIKLLDGQDEIRRGIDSYAGMPRLKRLVPLFVGVVRVRVQSRLTEKGPS